MALLVERAQLTRTVVDGLAERDIFEFERLRAREIEKSRDHFRKATHFVQQGRGRRAPALVHVEVLHELCIAVQSCQRIFKLVGEPRRHLAEALQILFQRDLLAQLRHLCDIRDETKRAAPPAFRQRVDRRDGRPQPPQAAFRSGRLDLFTAIHFTGLEATLHHLGQFRRIAQEAAHTLTYGLAVRLDQGARRAVDDRCAPAIIKSDKARGHAGDNTLAESLRGIGARARLGAQNL